MNNNYTIIHCHTDLSNGVTNIDSVTKYNEYIDRALELNMKSIAFTEHGNVFEYYKKHSYCKNKGIKYIHGQEFYITETLSEKKRDNYHCCLYATDYESFLELNELSSIAFNRKDGHYYYVPRITFEELYNTSDKIIISTACIGGVFKSSDEELKSKYLNFLSENKDRCFLEIQHHLDEKQIDHNRLMLQMHKNLNIPLIVGTDTHALNERHAKGRRILQESKDIFFENENKWDITLKSYEELVECYKQQNSIPEEYYLQAIENTNVLADMIKEFDFDKSHKYPKLYDNSMEVFLEKIKEGIKYRGIESKSNYEEYQKRIAEEVQVYKQVNAIDYMLLQTKIIEDAKNIGGVKHGYGRGSVTGSIIAYLLGITEVDSIKYNLNFFRFLNPSRVTNADIDCDFDEEDREWVRNYLFNMEGVKAVDIITFNTIALKGAIRDVGRAFKTFEKGVHKIADVEIDEICKNIDEKEDYYRKKYPLLFEYVDIVKGTVVSIGSHPSGILVSDMPIESTLGLCTLSGNENFVTQLSMKPLDELFYVKLDVLGLDSIGIINKTCELAEIKRLTPDNIDLYDEKVWQSIIEDTTAIFQMESSMAHKYFKDITRSTVIEKIKKSISDIRLFDLFMFICGAIRPAGENFRDDASNGIIKDNGFNELNEFLHETLGYLLLQEQIMQFLVRFCGYSEAESDTVRRAIAKKGDTTSMLEEIKRRFLEYTPEKYNVDLKLAEKIIEPFLLDIKSASGYGFSKNHNVPYSITGYAEGWLRYYYPLEFISTCLNIWSNKEDKIIKVTEYANKKGIKIKPPKFRYSKKNYFPDKESNTIYKGVGSIKFLNNTVGDELYNLRNNKYNDFLELLIDLNEKTSINSRQLDILIKLQFFSEFGKTQKLLKIVDIYNAIYTKKQFSKSKLPFGLSEEIFKKYAQVETKAVFKEVDKVSLMKDLIDKIPNVDIPLQTILEAEINNIGYVQYKNPKLDKKYVLITSVDCKYTPKIATYSLGSGVSVECKIPKQIWENLSVGNIIYIKSMEKRQKSKKVGENEKGKPIFEKINEYEWYITNYSVINSLIDNIVQEVEND